MGKRFLVSAFAAVAMTAGFSSTALAAGPPGANTNGANCRGQFIAGNTYNTGMNIEGAADLFFGGSVQDAQQFIHNRVCA